MSKQKVIAIVGPTSSGKTSLGIFLAQKLHGEVISADSRQVYRGLDIGTGKVTKKEMAGVPHHLLNVASPKKQFTVDDFVKHAKKAMQKINLPIVVGGTGFYVDTLLGRMDYPEVPPNPTLRHTLEKKTTEKLFTMLQKLDPRRAKEIDRHNPRRLVRAIEIAKYVFHHTPHSHALQAVRPRLTLALHSLAPQQYEVLWLGINPADKKLKQNIHKRLLARIKLGLILEGKRLHKNGLSYKRMEALGLEYRYLARLLQGTLTKQAFAEELEREIWRYAKRQRTWFKRNKDIHWVTSKTEALKFAKEFLR